MRPDLLAFAFLIGMGFGIAISAVCIWLAGRVVSDTLPAPKPQVLPGLIVRDSTMGEFDAAVRGGA